MKKYLLFFVFNLLFSLFIYGQNAKKHPNILIILVDDLGYGDLSCNGNVDIKTRNIDQFASQSVRIEPFYSQPVCSPSRAQLLTGRHFLKTGVWGVHGGRDYLNLDETTLAQKFKTDGYNTGMIGKWHLGKNNPYLPYHRGFDIAWSQIDLYNYFNPKIDNNGNIFTAKGWTVDYFTDRAIEFMNKQNDQPFFLYLAYTSIHEPFQAPDSIVAKYVNNGLSKSLATLYAMTEQLDNNIGRLLQEMERTGLADNTLIWFLSDNGPIGNPVNMPHLTQEEMNRRNIKGMRGQKGSVYENGLRVPSFVRFGKNFPVHTIETPVNIFDIFPTVLELAQIKSEGEKPLDGTSILPLLYGKTSSLPSRYLVAANHEIDWKGKTNLYSFLDDRKKLSWGKADFAVYFDNFKLVRGLYDVQDGQNIALYKLDTDPKETIDVCKQYPAQYQKMEDYLTQWWTKEIYKKSRSYYLPIFYIGYAKDSVSELYVCAPKKVEGGLITKALTVDKWSNGNDALEFDVVVETAGKYAITTKLKKGSKAGKLLLSIDNKIVEANVDKNNLSLGEINLSKGKFRLRISIITNDQTEGTVIEEFEIVSFIIK